MSHFSAVAILLRRIDYSDNDLIVTLLTREYGKLSAVAKSAKKSRRRFGGILEPFCRLNIVCQNGRGKLTVLQEASLLAPYEQIRTDIYKTAHAGYWAELAEGWLEEKKRHPELFHLLDQSLKSLDSGSLPPEILSLRFQLKLLGLAGVFPNMVQCVKCSRPLDDMPWRRCGMSPERGGAVCRECSSGVHDAVTLSKGSIKQLLWLSNCTPEQARRLCFSDASLQESTAFAEAFTPFHLGRSPKSLAFLKQIRSVNSEQLLGSSDQQK